MFNKNPFGIAIYNAANTIDLSNGSASKVLPCTIDKKNLDSKSPPKSPFKVQVALKSSLDIYYFEVPCLLHNLIDLAPAAAMKQEEFKKFWEMIPKANESTLSIPKLNEAYTSSKFNSGDVVSNLV